jgi:CheY-like chemotaxis protein
LARVVVFVPDLLFGSRVLESVRGAGHEPVLAADLEAVAAALPTADALIVDLTTDADARTDGISAPARPAVPVLAFYSHVEAAVRERALAAGFELVVPRSRMAREGAQLVSRLLEERP